MRIYSLTYRTSAERPMQYASISPPRSSSSRKRMPARPSLLSSAPVCTAPAFPTRLTHVGAGGTGQLISRLTNDEIDVAM